MTGDTMATQGFRDNSRFKIVGGTSELFLIRLCLASSGILYIFIDKLMLMDMKSY